MHWNPIHGHVSLAASRISSKNLKVNYKEEWLMIMRDLAPYLRLTFLSQPSTILIHAGLRATFRSLNKTKQSKRRLLGINKYYNNILALANHENGDLMINADIKRKSVLGFITPNNYHFFISLHICCANNAYY